MRGPDDAFEGPAGFVQQLLAGAEPDRAPLTGLDDLEQPRRILDSHIKRWPLGYVAQSGVEAALRIHASVPNFADIVQVTITTYDAAVARMADAAKFRPETRETADHSLPYAVATALKHGKVDTSSFAPEAYLDEKMHSFLQTSVQVLTSDRFNDAYPQAFPTKVTVQRADGSTVSEEVWYPAGHALNRLPDEELRTKFRECASSRFDERRAGQVLDAASDLEAADTIADLAMLLAEPPAR
jgi:2-methylcitrate dehydratase